MEARIIGTEKVTLIDGSQKEVEVRAVRYSDKLRLSRQFTNTKIVGNKPIIDIDNAEIMLGILKLALGDQVDVNDLDFDSQTLYDKYFKGEVSEEKKPKSDK